MKSPICFCILGLFISFSSGDYVVDYSDKSQRTERVVRDERLSYVEPIIYEMKIDTVVSNRYAKTLVTSKVRNRDEDSQETTFTVILPEKAFISKFILQMDGKEYKAYVEEKKQAKKIYDAARARGQSAGLVSVCARDSNKFTVSVNVEAGGEAVFLLTYEELLERRNNQYELVLNIHPGQIVEKLDVKVHIKESKPLKFVKSPSVRTGNEIDKQDRSTNELAKINIIKRKSAVVEFHPDKKQQEEFAKRFGKFKEVGLAGQFVVQYDVKRDEYGGDIFLQDGYFVHFFAPDELEPLPKHIVFVLDTSGSMAHRKINQLKDAMNNIIDQLQPNDEVSLIEFNTYVYAWNIQTETKHLVEFDDNENPFINLDRLSLPKPALVSESNNVKFKAKKVIEKLNSGGLTNIITALNAALSIVKANSEDINCANENYQPIILFLTDGEPLVYDASRKPVKINTKEKIYKIISRINANNNKVPIFTLSFGDLADKAFLRKLSLKNLGFSRHIYEAADAAIQLENFYNEISIPLLSEIKFEYTEGITITDTQKSVYFKGGEITFCGTYDVNADDPFETVKVRGTGNEGQVVVMPSVVKPVESLERLWAYLTVKNKLMKREIAATDADKRTLTVEALHIALKYSFVTDITSLVVVKPNGFHSSSDLEPSMPSLMTPEQMPTGMYGSPGMSSFQFPQAPVLNSVPMVQQNSQLSPPACFGRECASFQPTSITNANSMMLTELKRKLPWLESAMSYDNTLYIKGRKYALVTVDMVIAKNSCSKTPLNGTGYCTVLKNCPQVYSYLTDFPTYQKYFCPIANTFAGVCCLLYH